MPITPNNDRKTRQQSHAQVKEPCPFKARGRRGVNRLGGPLKAPRAAGRKSCRFPQDHLLCAVARVFRVRDA